MNAVVAIEGRGGRAVVAVDPSKRHEWPSLPLPCILRSVHELRCGLHEHARATASMCGVELTSYATDGDKDDGLSGFIASKCPDARRAISACDDCAKMAMKTLTELGDCSLEEVLLRRKWKGDMHRWLVGLTGGRDDARVAPKTSD